MNIRTKLEPDRRFTFDLSGLSVLIAAGVAVATASCNQDAATHTDTANPGVAVTDSGGVTTVALGRIEDLSPPRLTPTLVYSTRQSGIELFRATAALFLDAEGVALANSGAREVLLLAEDGSLANRAGRPGEGPGEFGDVTSMFKAADGFLVYDARMGRMSEFNRVGDFVTSWSFGSESSIVDVRPLARGSDGTTLAIVGDSRVFYPGEVRRDTTPLMMFPRPDAEPDTLTLVPATEWSYAAIPGGGATRFEVGFGLGVVAIGLEDRALVGETGSLDLSVYRADGQRTRWIHGSGGGGEVSDGDVAAWRSERLAQSEGLPPEFVQIVEEIPYNETFPAFQTAVLGPGEMVWIGLFAHPGADERVWLVIGPDGQLRGRIDLPTGAEVLAIGVDRFALVQSDEMGVEDFQVHAY